MARSLAFRACSAFTLGAMLAAAPAFAQELTDARRIEVARRLNEASVSLSVGRSTGSGFLVGDEHWIVTNAHVVAHYRQYPVRIQLGDGTVLPGRVLAYDPRHDLAIVLPVGEVRARPLELGESDDVQVGQTVLAFGSPYGLAGTLTQGIVSARRDLPGVGGGEVRGLIQTDAQINPGNSGGPLVNALGQVVGVNTAILSRTGGSQGIGFAVPSSYVRDMVAEVRRELREEERVARAHPSPAASPDPNDAPQRVDTPVWLGIYGDDFASSGFRGVRVRQVVRGGPAQRAGLLGAVDPPPAAIRRLGVPWTGHIILAVDGHPVRSMTELQRVLGSHEPGDRATLTLTVGPGVVSGEAVVQLAQPPPQVRQP